MLVQFYPVRETTNKGGALVWRLLVQRFVYEGAGSATISALAGDTTLERSWTTARYDGATSSLRTSGEYSGPVTDTVTFDATGGIVTYDITDKLSPVRAPDIVEVEARVNGVLYETHGFTSGDVFTRGGALDGELILQKLLQATDTDAEEYLEDMINRGWNFSSWLEWTEQLDAYVTALRQYPLTIVPTIVSISVTDPLGLPITTGDGKTFWRVPDSLDGQYLRGAWAALVTPSSSGVVTTQIANVTRGYDLLTTRLIIDANEASTSTAATAPVIDTASSHDLMHVGDLLSFDVDAAGTNAVGLQVALTFRTT